MRREGEEDLFDGVQGAVGKDIDGVDDVVEESLFELVLGLEGSKVRIQCKTHHWWVAKVLC